jgi:eukaryotic-like serine/threonine-protein kinase
MSGHGPDELAPGTRVGDYVIDADLVGTAAELRGRATHDVLPRRALIRVLRRAKAGQRDVAHNLLREACLLEALNHPSIPRVYECGTLADERPWLALALVEGESLAEPLALGVLPVVEVIAIVRAVADGLAHAHARGIVHRNVRPDAIVRGPRGISLVEWGDARAHDSAQPRALPPSSQAYRAPELATAQVDGRADIYALASVARVALAGGAHVPAGVVALLDAMRAQDRARRPQAAEVAAAAARLANELAETAALEADVLDVEVDKLVDLSRDGGDSFSELRIADLDGPTALKWTPPLGVTARRDAAASTPPPAPAPALARTKTDR